MSFRRFALLCLAVLLTLIPFRLNAAQDSLIAWKVLPEAPELGSWVVAAAGRSAACVLTAPEAEKDSVLVQVRLHAGGPWDRRAATLPGFCGASAASLGDGIVLVGGISGDSVLPRVRFLSLGESPGFVGGLPPLPVGIAFGSVVLFESRLLVLGGATSLSPVRANGALWSISLEKPVSQRRTWDAGEGLERLLPAAVVHGGKLYVMGGLAVVSDRDRGVRLEPLRDGFVLGPDGEWKPIKPAPCTVLRGLAAASGPRGIIVVSPRALRVPGLGALQIAGACAELWYYDTVTDEWTHAGRLPAGLEPRHILAAGDSLLLLGNLNGRSVALSGQLRAPPGHFRSLDYLVLALYSVGLVLLGAFFARRERSTEDFFLAGRRVPWWAAGISIFGTQLSAITYMAVPAKSFATDWTFYLSPVTIVMVAPLLVRFYLPIFRREGLTSAYEYLEKRFGLPLRVFGSTIFVLFQLGRIAIVLFLPALALSTVTGIDVATSVLLMGLVSIVYTVLGGIEAVIWTDVIQVLVLAGGAVLSLALVFAKVDGGALGVLQTASAQGKFHMFNWTWDATVASVWVVLVGNWFAQLGPYTTDQAVIQRYLTTPDERQAAKGIWLNALLSLPASGLFFLLGTALYVFYKQHPQALHPGLSTDAVFPWFVVQQLPAGISGLVVAGLFAASMSSLDSSMNSIATVIVTDYYRRFSRSPNEATALRLARWITVLVGLFGTGTALLMAALRIESLWDVFLRLLSFMGGALAGVFLLAVFTRRATGTGALVGAMCAVLLLVWVHSSTPIHFFLHAAIGSVGCFVIGYLVSLLFPAGVGRRASEG